MFTIDNYLLHGNDYAYIFEKCDEIRKSIFPARVKVSIQDVPATNGSTMCTSLNHHEFDMSCCYNSNSSHEYVNYIKYIASLNRIDNMKHMICIHNVQLMKPSQMSVLKLMIQDYSDRTFFVITSSKISSIPKSILSQCIMIRCSGNQLFDASTSKLEKPLQSILSNAKDTEKARDFAYLCMTYNISFPFFSYAVIRVVKGMFPNNIDNVMPDVVSILANNEANILKVKKSIMVWEQTLFELMHFIQQQV